ncbi:MAG: glucosamine-6-phosphate deaminase [Planctomycetota bacterium]
MQLSISDDAKETGEAAAATAAARLKRIIEVKGRATFIAATGLSQVEFLRALAEQPGIEWAKTRMYHLDEYVGLPASHPASFRRYLRERLIERVHPGTVHLIEGDGEDPEAECDRLGRLLAGGPLDLAFVGIGENGHLAFNDPPADFETDRAFIVVELDEGCRAQQVHEGWFETLDDVPRQAITVTIKQIMRARCIIGTVPEARKAEAVRCSVEGPVDPACPASILLRHDNAHLFLDRDSAGLLESPAARPGPAETG